MFLIDQPYVSDFLIKTIKDNNYKIVSTKIAKTLVSDETLNWVSEKDAIEFIEQNPNFPIYINSENALPWIGKNLKYSRHTKQLPLLKNKAKFRDLIKNTFPDFFYKTVELKDIPELSLDGIGFPFVIKPSLGFFSIGVHIIRNLEEWQAAKKELNVKKLQSIFPKEVLDTSIFIIEEYIEGEEFAVDCYFNNLGEVVILNILHHKFSSGTDISDRVYSTSKNIVYKNKNNIEDFLNPIGKKIGLKNFPAHVELRIDAKGQIRPIEINPLRFGGWCTTGDLSWYAFGINSYEYFIDNKKPDWENIFKTENDKKYSIIVLDNNSGIKPSEISGFNYVLLNNDLENALVIRKLNIKEYPVFGFVFAETSKNNDEELDNILVSDLRKYIITNRRYLNHRNY